ncbi:unnamed protein product [Closterium sp. Yama58-4]|nr:unnamed protein product [Closterium sp. Yama58-4]
MASSSLCAPSLGPHIPHLPSPSPPRVWHAEPSQQQQQHPRLFPSFLHEEVAESEDPCDRTVPARTTDAAAANFVIDGTAATAVNAASVDYSQLSAVDWSQHATFFAQERSENFELQPESQSQPLESSFPGGFGGGFDGSVLHGVDCGAVDHLVPVNASAATEGPFRGISAAGGGDFGFCALPPAASCGIGAEHVQEVTPLAVLETIRALPGLAGGPAVPHRPMSRGAKAAVARQSLETPLVSGWEEARGVGEGAGIMEAEVVAEGRQGPDTGLFEGGVAAGREVACANAGESTQSAGTKRARELGVAEAVPPVSKAARGLWEVVACRERALADAADAIDPADFVNNAIDAIGFIGAIGAIGAIDLVQAAAGAGAVAVDGHVEAAASGVLGAGGVEEAMRGELEWFAGEEFGTCMGSLFGGKVDGVAGMCAGQCVCCGGVKNTTTWTGCHDLTMAGVAGLSDDVISQA